MREVGIKCERASCSMLAFGKWNEEEEEKRRGELEPMPLL
jgi:hypothetical protein